MESVPDKPMVSVLRHQVELIGLSYKILRVKVRTDVIQVAGFAKSLMTER